MISDKNTRTLITLPKELKVKLEEIAKRDGRTFNNFVVHTLNEKAQQESHKKKDAH